MPVRLARRFRDLLNVLRRSKTSRGTWTSQYPYDSPPENEKGYGALTPHTYYTEESSRVIARYPVAAANQGDLIEVDAEFLAEGTCPGGADAHVPWTIKLIRSNGYDVVPLSAVSPKDNITRVILAGPIDWDNVNEVSVTANPRIMPNGSCVADSLRLEYHNRNWEITMQGQAVVIGRGYRHRACDR